MVIIIVILIVGFLLILPIGLVIAAVIVGSRGKAKTEAKEILYGGKAASPERIAWLSSTLSTIPNDLEAADLWRKLQELKEAPLRKV